MPCTLLRPGHQSPPPSRPALVSHTGLTDDLIGIMREVAETGDEPALAAPNEELAALAAAVFQYSLIDGQETGHDPDKGGLSIRLQQDS